MNECDAHSANMIAYRTLYNSLEGDFDGCELQHVGRESNEEADRVANIGSTCARVPPCVLLDVTPSESALCKFQRNPPNPHRNDSKVPTRHLRAGGKRSSNISQQSSMGPTEQIYTTRLHESRIQIYGTKIQITLKTI